MFRLFGKKSAVKVEGLKPFSSGRVVGIEEVPDEVFSQKVLGDGLAIWPDEGKLYAPADGTVTVVMADTKHACGMELDNGVQILLHVGLDTLELGGKGFSVHVKEGQRVKSGDLLIEFDREIIKNANLKDIIIMVVTENPKNFSFQKNIDGKAEAKKSMILTFDEL